MLPLLLLWACGNSDSAPRVSDDDPIIEIDADMSPVATGDAGRRPPPDNTVSVGSRSDAGTASQLDGSSGGGATDAGSSDARAQELGAFSGVERLLVADGRSARVHVLDVPSRNYLDTLSLNGPGAIYAGANGRFGYVLESAQNLVQVVSLGLPDPAEISTPTLSAPRLERTSFNGLSPSAFSSYANDVTILFTGSAQLATFDLDGISTGTSKYTGSVASALPAVLLHLGDRVIVNELDTSSGLSRLRLLDDKLARVNRPELPCDAPEGASETGGTVAVGCADGVLLWKTSESSTKTLRYPSAAGVERVHKLVASPLAGLFMTLLGDQLCLVSDEFSCEDAPPDVIDYAFDATGKRALVLTRDGTLHLLDGETLSTSAKLSGVVTAVTMATPQSELPGLAVGRRNIYVSDPSAARIHIVDSAAAKETGKLEVPGGFPTQVVVFRYDLE